MSSMLCPSNAFATVATVAFWLSSTRADVPGVISPFTESSVGLSMLPCAIFLAIDENAPPWRVTCTSAKGAPAYCGQRSTAASSTSIWSCSSSRTSLRTASSAPSVLLNRHAVSVAIDGSLPP
jgi:hypothetical protein